MVTIVGGFFGVVDCTWNDKPADSKSSSLLELFQEFVGLPFMSQQSIDGSHCYTEVDKKFSLPWTVLLIPMTGVMGVMIVHIYNSINSSTNSKYNDKDYMLLLLRQCGKLLRLASEELKGDLEVVQAALRQNTFALQYASEELRGNKSLVLAAVQSCSLVLEYASEELKDDRDVVLAAVQRRGLMLKHASERLKDDRDVVLVAARENRRALAYASPRLQADGELKRALKRPKAKGNQHRYLHPQIKGIEVSDIGP